MQDAKAGGGAQAAKQAAQQVVRRKAMSRDQALEVLNFSTTSTPAIDEILKQYERYFKANDPKKGGSLYLQSKVLRAKEALEYDLKQQQGKGKDSSSSA